MKPFRVGHVSNDLIDKTVPYSAAERAILDRGYGKPSRYMNIEESMPMAILSEEPMSEEEWQRQYYS